MMILQGILALFLPTILLVLVGLLLKRVDWFRSSAALIVFGIVLPFLSFMMVVVARTAQTDTQYIAILDIIENMYAASYVVSGIGALIFVPNIRRMTRR